MPRHAFVFCWLVAVMALPGCNFIGAAAYVLIPQPPVPPKFELEDKPALIVVEDRHSLIQDPTVVRRINGAIRNALEEEKVVTTGFVSQAEVTALEGRLGSAYRSTSLQEIGRQLGARQVIYAEITAYRLQLGGGVYRPAMSMSVKVIDIDQGQRAFPPPINEATGVANNATSEPVATELRATSRAAEGNAAQTIAARQLAAQAGLDVARLFFEWRRPEPGALLRSDQP